MVDRLTFTTFNLLNLNEPGLPIYSDADGLGPELYARKIDWTGRMLRTAEADVFGFQELWHADALAGAFEAAGLRSGYRLIVPDGHDGDGIVTAAAVREGMIAGEPEWIARFPDAFRLEAEGDDPQSPAISVALAGFSRPVLRLAIRPRPDRPVIQVFVTHLKSKRPASVWREDWYRADPDRYRDHADAIGRGLSTIRRIAEATALRIILTDVMKRNNDPVVVMGDLNDGQLSNTLAIVTEQPKYLDALVSGGRDTALYSGQTMQQLRSERDVYYTYIYQNFRDSLDHILFSEEFYDNSRDRIWAFDGLDIYNDHLNDERDQERFGASDHGVVRITFRYKPAPGVAA